VKIRSLRPFLFTVLAVLVMFAATPTRAQAEADSGTATSVAAPETPGDVDASLAPSPEKIAEVEARTRVVEQEAARAQAGRPASGATVAGDSPTAGVESLATPDFMPWIGTQQTWCTYSNPGSPGSYCSGYHPYQALDIGMPVGTQVVAAGDGTVVDISTGCSPGNTSCGGGGGNYVSIAHVEPGQPNRWTRYLHMSAVSVTLGQKVTKGQAVGRSGWTGHVSPLNESAAHLHFDEQLARYGSQTDPGEMYSCIDGNAVPALGSRGLTRWNQMPWGTMLRNDNAGCMGVDADADGVADTVDNCPDVVGPASTDGCDLDQASSQRTKADFNHDGRGDLAFVHGPGGTGSQILLSYGQTGGGVSTPALAWDSGAFGWEWERLELAAGDFTKDGYDDLVLFYSVDGGGTLMFIAYGSAGGLMAPRLMWNSGAGGFDLTKAKVTAGDYNGDGFADVGLLAAKTNNQIAFLIGMGTAGGIGAPTTTWTSPTGYMDGTRLRVTAGDFDGDGRGDLGIFEQVSSNWARLWSARGRSGVTGEPTIYAPETMWDSGSGGWDAERTKIAAADFDGDGRSDVALLRGYDNKRTTLSVAYASGVGLYPPSQVWDSGSGNWELQYTRLAPCDAGASGRARLGLLYGSKSQAQFSFTYADTNNGWVGPQQQLSLGGWNALRTQVVGCDLVPPTPTSRYHALAPARLLDSRDGTGGYSTAWGPGESRDLDVLGSAGVPSAGVTSVVLNVTVTGPSDSSFLTVFPQGLARPMSSNLNFVAGQTVANQVIVKVSPNGKISMFNNSGNVHVIADVLGYYDGGTGTNYTAVVPSRILDSRNSIGGYSTAWTGTQSREVQVTGVGNVPANGVSAVLVNLTATNTSTSSHLTVWPTGQARPNASVLNFGPGQTVPNLVLATVGAGGRISIFNNAGTADVLADVVGWFGTSTGDQYTPLAGSRILDSRFGIGGYSTPWGAGDSREILVTDVGGVPPVGVSAVVLNVTVTGPSNDSHVTVWPAGEARPNVSNLNFVAGQTVPNLVVVKVGVGGKVALFNNAGSAHLIADVVGYYA